MDIYRHVRLDAAEIQEYSQLTNRELRASFEAEYGLSIVETELALRSALEAGVKVRSIMVDEAHVPLAMELSEAYDIPAVYVVDFPEMEKLVGYQVTRGVLASVERSQPALIEDILARATRIAVLEDIVDVTNIGAIMRSAAALGLDAVILNAHCADPLMRRAIRVSMGTVFKVPWVHLSSLPDDDDRLTIPGLLDYLHENGFMCLALALRESAMPIQSLFYGPKSRLALFFGNESEGLSSETIELCDQAVIIPMKHHVDSLNVAASSAVAFWELCKEK